MSFDLHSWFSFVSGQEKPLFSWEQVEVHHQALHVLHHVLLTLQIHPLCVPLQHTNAILITIATIVFFTNLIYKLELFHDGGICNNKCFGFR
jgi:hypothetical protein